MRTKIAPTMLNRLRGLMARLSFRHPGPRLPIAVQCCITRLYSRYRFAGWLKGVKYGVILFLFSLCMSAGWSGVFNLPEAIWGWWNAEALVYYLVGGAALGWVTAKLSPE